MRKLLTALKQIKLLNALLFLNFLLGLFNNQARAQNCEAITRALLPNGAYDIRQVDFNEDYYKSIILFYKSHRDWTYQQAQSTSFNLGIPIGDFLVGIGLTDDAESYQHFIENIDFHYNNYEARKTQLKTRFSTVNVAAIKATLEGCMGRLTGISVLPIYTSNPTIVVAKFYYNSDYRGSPNLANLKVLNKTRNIQVNTNVLSNVFLSDHSVKEIIIKKTDQNLGVITFNSNARTSEGNSLSITIPATPRVVKPTTETHTITQRQFTFVPPHLSGDRDFDGNLSINSECYLSLIPDSTKLFLVVKMSADEIDGDTHAAGKDSILLYEGNKVIQIKSPFNDNAHINFTNDPRGEFTFTPYEVYMNQCIQVGCVFKIWRVERRIDEAMHQQFKNAFDRDFSNRGLVKTWKFIPDQDGDESGTLTRVTVITNPIDIVIVR
jgi:hypothetical protein